VVASKPAERPALRSQVTFIRGQPRHSVLGVVSLEGTQGFRRLGRLSEIPS